MLAVGSVPQHMLAAGASLLVTAGMLVPAYAGPSDSGPEETTMRFVTDTIGLRNARVGGTYEATVAGLVTGGGAAVRFRKVSGAGWIRVGGDGSVTGRPTTAGSTTALVEASNGDQVAKATIRIGVRPVGERLVPRLRMLSFNLLHGGDGIPDARVKQLRFLVENDVDVVGVQENYYTSARELAAALGWQYSDAGEDVGVISRYPITWARSHLFGFLGINARIRIDDSAGVGEQQVSLWNVHLSAAPYTPYGMCFGHQSEAELTATEHASGRVLQMTGILTLMAADLAHVADTPVVLTGDFNAPSHLDYTPATAARHCGYQRFAWPVSGLIEGVGLRDSYRVAHPDPATHPGDTWSPVFKVFGGGYGWDDHKGEPEPQDRIDAVHYAGGRLRVVESRAMWTGTPGPDPTRNEWPTDHAAVLTEFAVN